VGAEAANGSAHAATAGARMELWFEVQSFLVREAELLDDNRLHDWLTLLADDIRYRIPIRVTRERSAGPGFSKIGFHMDEDKGMLMTRVARLDTEYAWAEDPPSRTRRYVSNVRVDKVDDDVLEVRSNLLVYRGRHGIGNDNLIGGERVDRLRRRGDGFEIAARTVYLDHATLKTHNLAIFL
jgi:3-phenylpropionate/cinnamic acid dioxygenase small subunit